MRTSLDATELHTTFHRIRSEMWAWLDREGLDAQRIRVVELAGEGMVRCEMLSDSGKWLWEWVNVPVATPPPFITWPTAPDQP